jgi:hypothetical protein
MNMLTIVSKGILAYQRHEVWIGNALPSSPGIAINVVRC